MNLNPIPNHNLSPTHPIANPNCKPYPQNKQLSCVVIRFDIVTIVLTLFEDYHSEDCLNRPIFITIHQKLQILVVISSCQVEPIIMSRVIITQQRNCISVLYDVSQHTAAQNRCHISHILKPLSPRTITVTYMELRLGAVSVLQLLLTNPKYHCLN